MVEVVSDEVASEEGSSDSLDPAAEALREYAEELELLRQGRQAAADHHYDTGRRMMEEGRLPKRSSN